MKEYLIGITFLISFCVYLYIIGSAVIREEEKYSYKLIIGYFIYSFFVAVFGMIVQIFCLSWIIFAIYMVLLIVLSIILSIYRIRKHKIRIVPKSINNFIREHWFLFFLTLFLMFLTLFYINSYWFNNHLDDGYYINKMVILPYVENAFRITPGTGFISSGGINSYTFNTHELEISFYIYLLNITPTLFIRFFLAGFHYFLLINCIYAFAEKIISATEIPIQKGIIQYIPSIVILFAFNEMFLRNKGILFLQDSNQFCNAMYYGSSIVRTMGILMLLLPFIHAKKISLDMILKVIAISIVLISKSSIALPIIMATVISFSLVTMMLDKKMNNIFVLIIVIIIIGFNYFTNINNNVNEISQYAFQNVVRNINQVGFLFGVIIIFVSFMINKDIVLKINFFLILFIILIGFPFCNNLISFFSFYAFVAGRTFTCICYTIIIVAGIYLYLFLYTIPMQKYFKYGFISIIVVSLGTGSIYSIQQGGGSLFYDETLTSLSLNNALETWKNNNKFIPYSSIELGKVLNKLADEKKEDVNVISRELQNVNGYAYALATSLTAIAPGVKSVSAKIRYNGMNEDNPFINFSSEDQTIFERFMFQFDNEVYTKFKDILNKYPINCVILVVDDKEKYMNELGFKLYDKVISLDAGVIYYVYEK